MNIFQIIPNRVFIENEEDEIFVDNLIKQDIVDNKGKKIIKSKHKYIVKPLDTILSVSKKLNITEQELMEITNCKSLYIGQEIILPFDEIGN